MDSAFKSMVNTAVMYVAVGVAVAVLFSQRQVLFDAASKHTSKGSLSHVAKMAPNGEHQADHAPPTGVTVELTASDNGHFLTAADVNGYPIDVLVDTGATTVTMTYEDAERAGIFLSPSDFTRTGRTANGSANFAPVRLSTVRIGDIVVRDVEAGVAEPGKLHVTLLGMSFISKLSRADIRDGRLILHE